MDNKVDITQLGQYGIAAVALGLLAYALKLFHDSYVANTEAINQLRMVMEKQSMREQMFMERMTDVVQDTNQRVRRIEERL